MVKGCFYEYYDNLIPIIMMIKNITILTVMIIELNDNHGD